MTSTLLRPLTVALTAVALVSALGVASAAPRKNAGGDEAMSRAVAFETALTNVAESVSQSVVSIRVEVSRPQPSGFPFFFGGPGQGGIVRGGGSGVILRSDGYILTNNHVVAEANRIDVRLKNGKSLSNGTAAKRMDRRRLLKTTIPTFS